LFKEVRCDKPDIPLTRRCSGKTSIAIYSGNAVGFGKFFDYE